jgi:cytosolic prostaglandin-E synthase
LLDQSLAFKGTSEGKVYEVKLEFLNAVDAEGSTYKVLPRSIQMLLKKKKQASSSDDNDENGKFWPRLLKDKALEKNQVKIDWDRYVEEDDEEEGFDTSNLDGGFGMGRGGMGGGGMGGMDMDALMKQMGGMDGLGDMDGPDLADDDNDDAAAAGDDDDDDDLPELEKVK